MQISGTLYSYYFLCARKVWLYYHKISFEHESELVALGKNLDENSYLNQKHNVLIDGFSSIDFIKDHVVHEVKKSESQQDMAVNQLKYYLFLLKNKRVTMTGKINYPLQKKTLDVILQPEDMGIIENNLQAIQNLISAPVPPEAERIKACTNCAYVDFCFS